MDLVLNRTKTTKKRHRIIKERIPSLFSFNQLSTSSDVAAKEVIWMSDDED